MISNKKILAVITARGGSKGIPGKNIKPLLGKPLIAYTIEAAQKSGVIDRLILSTDDPAIADVARKYGCEVPFMRPAELANDTASSLSVIQHAVKYLKDNEGYEADYTLLLQPTSPLRQPFHIKEAAELAIKSQAECVLSVAEIPENFNYRKAMIMKDGLLRLINDDPVYKRISRRQELPKTYWSIGSLYLFKTNIIFHPDHPNYFGDTTAPYFVDEKYCVDINIPSDWAAAEEAIKKL